MAAKRSPVKAKTGSEPYIVGIGASAGGLDAMQELFDNIPENSGFGFVVVQHLSPDHKSLMGEILSKRTPMQVFEAEEGMQVMPDCVYLIPIRKTMTIKNGRLLLENKAKGPAPNKAIDIFLSSLAFDQKSKAVAIILSGTGTDGSVGIGDIKKNGGIVIVQDPMTAEFDGMPNAAVSSGFADLILPPEMMGDELVDFLKESPLLKSFSAINQQEQKILSDILELIKYSTSQDFSQYKLPTLTRRVAKKMAEKNIQSIAEYYKLLTKSPEEIESLAKEFLINVTKFFRDAEAFDIVKEKLIPALFRGKKDNEPVKLWSVACSTGEEAYSLAILLQEYLETHKDIVNDVKIFATDIDQEALNVASKGAYKEDSLKDVSPERLRKFFRKEATGYSVAPNIRKMVVFARHDIIKDPPFGKIDLLSCRNMLIYMNPNLQKSILKKFHFSLNENSYLFLGPSESLGTLKDYFKEEDRKWKLFRCHIKSVGFDQDIYLSRIKADSPLGFTSMRSKNAMNNIPEIFQDTMLIGDRLAGILIDKDFEVKQAVGSFKRFLNFPEGKFNFSLLKLVNPELSILLNAQVRKAIKENEFIVVKRAKFIDGTNHRMVNITVKPYLDQRDYIQPFIFIVIEELEVEPVRIRPASGKTGSNDGTRERELEDELREVRQTLQTVIEEVETSNEELQASNEEIISANEELQSTNEELQSLNEELHTVNVEHQLKIKELVELNDDLNNYFRNINIGQIYIDQKLRIRKFSPATTEQINLIETDIGRSIADISNNFQGLNFVNHVKEVMKTGTPVEKEVVMENGKVCLMRINPYLRQNNSIDGTVINFFDVTELKRLTNVVEAVFNSSPNAIIALEAVRDKKDEITDFRITAANENADRLWKFNLRKLIGKSFKDNLQPALKQLFPELSRTAATGEHFRVEYHDADSDTWQDLAAIRMMDGVVLTIADITPTKKASEMLNESFDQLQRTTGELQRSNSMLEQSNYDLVQFASVASHDLKEPLRKIQVYGNILKDKIENDLEKTERNYLNKMIAASSRMSSLIEDVLTLSKLSNTETSLVPTDITETIKQIMDDIDITIKEKNARIRLGTLPVIEARPGQMRQLFQNLLSNALKFTNGETPEINITAKKLTKAELATLGFNGQEQYSRIEVKDNGIGFDDKFSEKIFGLFQRLHGNVYQGTGLGLAICKKIVDNHNGQITVKSEPGKGATFTIILPLKKKE
jgi:two-component system CheB/CheR fusion protein